MSDQPEKIPPQDLLDWLGMNGAPNWALARPLGKLFGALLVLIFFAAVAAAVSVLFGTIRDVFWSDDGAGPNLGAGALVTAILGAPFLIWGTIIRHQSLRYQKEGHMTDRISKAVEQLGAEKKVDRIGRPVELHRGHPDQLSAGEQLETRTAIEWRDVGLEKQENEWVGASGEWQVFSETVPNLEVRIGAILSLERIAQDSTTHDKGRDHVRVMEILCAYIRENSFRRSIGDKPLDSDDGNFRLAIERWAKFIDQPPIDVQLAISVLGRRSAEQIAIERNEKSHPEGYRLDLSRSNLQGADLTGGDFSGANFRFAHLDSALMNNANFENSNLLETSAVVASAKRISLKGSNLGADFSFSILDQASFEFIEDGRTHSSFNGRHAKFRGSQILDARLKFRSLTNTARNWGVHADFSDASMRGSVFDGFDSRHEHRWPQRFHWEEKGEIGLAFYHCKLTPSILRRCSLALCFGDGSVQLPQGVERPEHWPSAELSVADFDRELAKWRADPAGYTPPPPP